MNKIYTKYLYNVTPNLIILFSKQIDTYRFEQSSLIVFRFIGNICDGTNIIQFWTQYKKSRFN